MTDEQKREYAEAIKAALGMSYGPPMEGEEGWVPPGYAGMDPATKGEDMTVEDADDEDFDATAQAIMDELREKKERRLAEERAKAAEPKPAPPSDDPWAVVGKAEDDGERIMDITRNFG